MNERRREDCGGDKGGGRREGGELRRGKGATIELGRELKKNGG